jgi:hypothetical protein
MEHSVNIQGTFRAHSRNVPLTCWSNFPLPKAETSPNKIWSKVPPTDEAFGAAPKENIQGVFSEHSVNIQ